MRRHARGGRPCEYTDEIADVICEAVASGGALYKMCQERDDLPSESSVYKWLDMFPQFAERYARARERQAERRAAEIVEIADTEPDAAVARNRIEARKWTAAKLLPKRYGDKTTTEITGPGGGPIEIVARRAIPDEIDEQRLRAIEAALRLALAPPEGDA